MLHGRDAILRVRDKLLTSNMILQLWADVKYHVPTGFGFSPKASGFYSFGDATALAGEGGVGDVVCLIQASAWNQTCRSTNDRCEALTSLKGCFLCVCFSPPVFVHRTINSLDHNRPSPRLLLWAHCYHQAARPCKQEHLHGVSHHLASQMPSPVLLFILSPTR